MSLNFFAANFLVEGRVKKAYDNFVESVYGVNEINNHNFPIETVLRLPLPLFHDYVNFQVKEKKKMIEKSKRENQKMLAAK